MRKCSLQGFYFFKESSFECNATFLSLKNRKRDNKNAKLTNQKNNDKKIGE